MAEGKKGKDTTSHHHQEPEAQSRKEKRVAEAEAVD